MTSTDTGLIAFLCVFAAALLGMLLRSVLPPSHVNKENQDLVKVAIGLLATMSALLLGLLVSSAKGSYDAQQTRVIQVAAKIAFLDRALAVYGPDAAESRIVVRRNVEKMIERIWPADNSAPQLEPFASGGKAVFESINKLSPQNENQTTAKAEALKTAMEIGELDSLMYAQAGMTIPKPLLVIVISWLSIIFLSFGLFASPNGTAITALGAAALSVASALFLLLELAESFGGVIGVSGAPMRVALSHLGG